MLVFEEEMEEVDVVVLVPGGGCEWGVGSIGAGGGGGVDGDGGTILQGAIIELTSKASVRAFRSIDHGVTI